MPRLLHMNIVFILGHVFKGVVFPKWAICELLVVWANVS